ncbi:hypothetical protein OA90_11940 [Labrenzia sp. OB1]|nr:hypothetical protein OA90_11940 [Labrenzia sp. OB1]
MGALATMLPDGQRLHLQYGPIDLVIGASGPADEINQAYNQARDAFEPVLDDLVRELPRLRRQHGVPPAGAAARLMYDATRPFVPEFITPMAAVAGSVADHVLARMIAGRSLTRAYVNNGGDIALHLTDGSFRIGICDDPVSGESGGLVDIHPEDGIGGIATSGWRGRSHSLGIADAVTVLAGSAAAADAAATLIANAVDVPFSPRVSRCAASALSLDSDLGDRLVTTDVGALDPAEIQAALGLGLRKAEDYLERGLISAAYLALAGKRVTVTQHQTKTIAPRNAAHA